jgi:hypothetical protein
MKITDKINTSINSIKEMKEYPPGEYDEVNYYEERVDEMIMRRENE